MAIDYQTRPFTVDEYFRLIDIGILGEDERVELLDGEIVVMPPPGPEHDSTGIRFNDLLVNRLRGHALVLPAGTVPISKVSAPSPDYAILAPREDYYRHARPRPIEDVFGLIELSKSTLSYDRGRKLRAYARARIREYWIADLVHWALEVHRDPTDAGYATTRIAHHGENVSFATLPNIEFTVDELLGAKE